MQNGLFFFLERLGTHVRVRNIGHLILHNMHNIMHNNVHSMGPEKDYITDGTITVVDISIFCHHSSISRCIPAVYHVHHMGAAGQDDISLEEKEAEQEVWLIKF